MKISLIMIAALLCQCSLMPTSANVLVDFEKGKGLDEAVVSSSYNGLSFSTLSYGAVLYADSSTKFYNVTSDNGQVYGQGEYFISGNCAAYIQGFNYIVRIDVVNPTSFFKVGYSSDRTITLKAFDANNAELSMVIGQPNIKSLGGSGLVYLVVSSSGSNISYVTLQAAVPANGDGFWLIDNVEVGDVVSQSL